MKYVLHLVMAFFFLVLTLTAAFAQGDAPTIFKGQGNTTKMVGASVQVPNNQVTKLTSSSVLVETGNNDILMNPSFESVTGYDNWTTTSSGVITTAETITKVIHGKKAVCLTTTSNTVSFYQDSTLYASQLDGNQQGTLRGQVFNNTGSTIYMCPRPAGASITSDYNSKCQAFESNNTWTEKELPIALGATSNGVEFKSNGNITATGSNLCFDDVSLKIGSVKATQSFDTTCDTIACQTTFGAYISAGGVVSNESMTDFINGNCSLSGTSNNRKSCTFGTGLFTVAPSCSLSTVGCTGGDAGGCNNVSNVTGLSSTSIGFSGANNPDSAWRANDVYITCVKAGVDYTAALTAQKTFQNTKLGSFSSINVDETKIGEVIYSSRATAPTGFISALNVSIGLSGATHNGQDYYKLYEQLWALAGLSTTAGDPYRISSAKGASALADWTAGKTITIDYATNELFIRAKGTGRNAGSYQASDNLAHNHGSNYIREGVYTGTLAAGGGLQLQSLASSSSGGTEARPKNVALYAYIRYLPESKFIMGSFNGLEKCADSYECTDLYSSYIDGTNHSQENLDWVTSVAFTAPSSTVTLKTGVFSVTPNCTITGQNSTEFRITAASSTSLTIQQFNSAGANSSGGFWIHCQKQGADYNGKTAKAVASDQHYTKTESDSRYVRGSGVIASATVSSAGIVSNEVGDLFNGNCSLATNVFTCTLTSGLFSGNPNCTAIAGGASGNAANVSVSSSSSTTWTFVTNRWDAAAIAYDFRVICHGIAP